LEECLGNEWDNNAPQAKKIDISSQKKPYNGSFKCNVNIAFSVKHNKVGVSACIWDDQGSYVIANEWFSPILQVDAEEALKNLIEL